jgi:hypothetical protein
VNIEKKLLALDKELHSILGILKKKRVKDLEDVVENSSGAWDTRLIVKSSLMVLENLSDNDCLIAAAASSVGIRERFLKHEY